jgi:exonuclease VII small subunit
MSDPTPIASAEEPFAYEAAASRIEAIIRRLDSGEAGLARRSSCAGRAAD